MEKQEEIYCPVCSKPIRTDTDICPHCEAKIKDIPKDRQPGESYPREIDLDYGKSRFFLWIIIGIIVLVLIAAIIFFGVTLGR